MSRTIQQTQNKGPENVLNGWIESANSSLYNKEFSDCVVICDRFINEAKHFPEKPRFVHAVTSLVIIKIQALVELNKWQEVLPFVTGFYGGVERCPAKVLITCLLLYAYMHDYSTCSAIVTIWLGIQENRDTSESIVVLQHYITAVLLPQNKFQEAKTVLLKSQVLGEERKCDYMRWVDQMERLHSEEHEKVESKQSDTDETVLTKSKDSLEADIYQGMFKRLSSWFHSKSHLLLVTFAIVLIFISRLRTQERLAFLWKAIHLTRDWISRLMVST